MVVAPPSEAATATVMAPASMVPNNAYSVNYFDDNRQVLMAFYKVTFLHFNFLRKYFIWLFLYKIVFKSKKRNIERW